MPFVDRLLGLFVAACSLGHAAQFPEPVFDGRDLRSQPRPRDPVAKSALATPYKKLAPGRSLLIHDCLESPWCMHPYIQFLPVMARAAESMQIGHTTALRSWISTLSPQLFREFLGRWPHAPNGDPPLHLLAVVNRLDLAEWRSSGANGHWTGAETRFVYGASYREADRPAHLTVIVEFQHHPLTWQQMKTIARRWASLGAAGPESFPEALAALLREVVFGFRDFAQVRIRTNSNPAFGNVTNATWHLRQWNLTANGWSPATLDDELDPLCYDRRDCLELKRIWFNIVEEARIKRYPIPAGSTILAGDQKFYSRNSSPVPILRDGGLRPRNILSLQQCSHCHRSETETEFTHIANREPGRRPAKLSPFLAGKDSAHLDVAFADIEAKSHRVELTVPRVGSSGTETVIRWFHDVARRRLFLAAVLIAPDKFNAKARELISGYNSNFSH